MKASDHPFPHELKSGASTYVGIKMRDYIAIQAMQGLLANPSCTDASFEQVANMAYSEADAMIKRSEVSNEEKA